MILIDGGGKVKGKKGNFQPQALTWLSKLTSRLRASWHTRQGNRRVSLTTTAECNDFPWKLPCSMTRLLAFICGISRANHSSDESQRLFSDSAKPTCRTLERRARTTCAADNAMVLVSHNLTNQETAWTCLDLRSTATSRILYRSVVVLSPEYCSREAETRTGAAEIASSTLP